MDDWEALSGCHRVLPSFHYHKLLGAKCCWQPVLAVQRPSMLNGVAQFGILCEASNIENGHLGITVYFPAALFSPSHCCGSVTLLVYCISGPDSCFLINPNSHCFLHNRAKSRIFTLPVIVIQEKVVLQEAKDKVTKRAPCLVPSLSDVIAVPVTNIKNR